MLKLGDYSFVENLKTRESSFMFFEPEMDMGASWSIDCTFMQGEYCNERIEPTICINPIETEAQNIEDLVGTSFSIESVEECDEREDLFTVFEMYPMCRYEVVIWEIKDSKVHVTVNGVAIEDDDEQEVEFALDVWLPIICDINDWSKFGL